jgi:hypothetical protein
LTLATLNAGFAANRGRPRRRYRTAEIDPQATFVAAPADGWAGRKRPFTRDFFHVEPLVYASMTARLRQSR